MYIILVILVRNHYYQPLKLNVVLLLTNYSKGILFRYPDMYST